MDVNKLILPAIKAHMGDWIYYISSMSLKDAAERIVSTGEIHSVEKLEDLLQRALTNRKKAISEYLVNQPQRLFNSIVVGVYEGDPHFAEIKVQDAEYDEVVSKDLEFLDGTLGFLIFNGNERMFAIDGQHRIAGILESIKSYPDIGDEEISVIFVGHKNTATGKERTRRLFTTLNRYAKPVNKKEIIALDVDDITAIITRLILVRHSKYEKAITTKGVKNLPPKDKYSFTTIVALYDGIDYFMKKLTTAQGYRKDWPKYKKMRPPEDIIENYLDNTVQLLDLMIKKFRDMDRYFAAKDIDNKALPFRHDNGGNILFRPIGLEIVIRTISNLLVKYKLKDAVKLVSKIEQEISKKPWVGLLWDDENKRMLTSNKGVAEKVLYYSIEGDLAPWRKWGEKRLRTELAGILNISVNKVHIEVYN